MTAPAIAYGVGALANLIGGASQQAQGSAAVDEAARIAHDNYNQTAGLRQQAIQRMMNRQPQAPDLTGIVTDTRNPYNTRFASPANYMPAAGPDYSAATAQDNTPAAIAARNATIQAFSGGGHYDPNDPFFGQNSQIGTGKFAGLASLDPLAGSMMEPQGPTPIADNLRAVPPSAKLTDRQVAQLTAEAKATGNIWGASQILKAHGQQFPPGTSFGTG